MYKIGIVDDEIEVIEKSKDFIGKICAEKQQKLVLETYTSPTKLLNEYKPGFDILFLDIMMPDIDGLELAHKIRKVDPDVTIVFITSMARFAINGYEVGAFDFILKPVEFGDFSVRFEKILKNVDAKKARGRRIVLKVKNEFTAINSDDIVYVESNAHYVTYHTFDKEITQRGKLTEVMELLDESQFVFCNKCYIVNIRHISKVDDSFVHLADGSQLIISRLKKKSFLAAVTDYYLKG